MQNRIVLFEDQFLADMNPVALTRPAFAATCACLTLWEVAAAAGEVSWLVRSHLERITARRFGAGVRRQWTGPDVRRHRQEPVLGNGPQVVARGPDPRRSP